MGETNEGRRVKLANPCHPGEILRDCIRESGQTVGGAAKRIGISRAMLNRILSGQGRISARLALILERMGWANGETWLRMQAAFDLAQERRKVA